MSSANFFLYSQVILILKSWSNDQRLPRLQYSSTIHSLGSLVQAPRNNTTFGCLITSITAHSFLNSSSFSCSIISFLISLIATTVCFHLPLWTIPYPPSDNLWSKVNWLYGISLFWMKARASLLKNCFDDYKACFNFFFRYFGFAPASSNSMKIFLYSSDNILSASFSCSSRLS